MQKLFSLGFFSGRSGDFFNRGGVLDEFHEGHRSVVANAEAHLQDAGVAALTVGKARADHVEELDDDVAVAQAVEGEALVGNGRFLGERDQGLDDAAGTFSNCHTQIHV